MVPKQVSRVLLLSSQFGAPDASWHRHKRHVALLHSFLASFAITVSALVLIQPDHVAYSKATPDEPAANSVIIEVSYSSGMITLQALTGMRPGEVCAIRWQDIAEDVEHKGKRYWVYAVASPKTRHFGHGTHYVLNEAAQAVLNEFRRPGGGYVFRPCDAMRERGKALRAERQSPVEASLTIK